MPELETAQPIEQLTPVEETTPAGTTLVQTQSLSGVSELGGVSARLGSAANGNGAQEPPPERMASLLGSAQYTLPANAAPKAGVLTGLQQHYGNAYVQRVMNLVHMQRMQSSADVPDSIPEPDQDTENTPAPTHAGTAVQSQVMIGQADDLYEREAETISHQVTTGQPASPISRIPSSGLNTVSPEQSAENHTAQTGTSQGHKATSTPFMSAVAAQAIHQKGAGSPLPSSTQRTLESRMGVDFSGVRVHTDSAAQAAATGLNARAFTHQSDIWLGPGASPHDLPLMAHEATHVVQQGGASPQGLSPSPAVQRTASTEPVVVQRGILDTLTSAAGAVVEMGADAFWSVLESLAPSLVPILREIADKGIIGYLQEKLSTALNLLFDRFGDNSGVLAGLIELFRGLVARAGEILGALASGDCEPLFAALNQLKDIVQQMAGDAWNAITEFFQPIGDFFSHLWQSLGAPVMDWLSETAGEVWQFLQDLGAEIWSWTQPVRDTLSSAWEWVKEQLGLGESEGDDEGGLIQWIQDKASEAWEAIKEQLQPIIEPIQAVVQKIQALLPLDAIVNLRETVTGWLDNVSAMADAMNQPDGVTEEQASLRDAILPAVLRTMQSLRLGIIETGFWISDQIGMLVVTVLGFMTSLSSIPLLSGVSGAMQWLQDRVTALGEWVQSSVIGVYTLVGDGLVFLSSFVEPILTALQKIVEVLGNLIGKLPDLIMGPVWWIMPDCIRNPIKEFILTQILSRIPIFSQLLAIPDVWARVQATAMRILSQIFLDGNLAGALWTYFSAILNLIGLPPELVVGILSRAASALSDILTNPVGFLLNLLRAVKEGFVRFFSNIGTHLLNGVTGWLFGQLQSAGISPPADLSFRAILDFVLQILGITIENIFLRLEQKIGKEKVDLLRQSIKVLTNAWEWISLLVNEGPGALWEQLKEKLSDLWSQVLTSVIGWISQTIIVQATVKLLSFLDPSGIMAVVNSCIAIYKAIESFVQYLREMLEIVHSVLEGIGSIAKGVIEQAAAFLERSLAQSLPIAIGFLANQIGLGSVGNRIQEMVEAVRERVNQGIDWVIDKALSVGRAVLDTLGIRGGTEQEEVTAEAVDVDPTDHEAIADRAVADLEQIEGTPESYKAVRAEKEVQAREIEQRYTTILSPGIALTVVFKEAAVDVEDQDLDFEVVIAPNMTKKGGSVSTSSSGGPYPTPTARIESSLARLNVTLPYRQDGNNQTRAHDLDESLQRHHYRYLYLFEDPTSEPINSIMYYFITDEQVTGDAVDVGLVMQETMEKKLTMSTDANVDTKEAEGNYSANSRDYIVDSYAGGTTPDPNHFFVTQGYGVWGSVSTDEWNAMMRLAQLVHGRNVDDVVVEIKVADVIGSSPKADTALSRLKNLTGSFQNMQACSGLPDSLFEAVRFYSLPESEKEKQRFDFVYSKSKSERGQPKWDEAYKAQAGLTPGKFGDIAMAISKESQRIFKEVGKTKGSTKKELLEKASYLTPERTAKLIDDLIAVGFLVDAGDGKWKSSRD